DKVTFSRETDIVATNLMRYGKSEDGRTHRESVLIVMERLVVTIVMVAEFYRVALLESILPVQVGYIDLLIACIEGVQAAVGILLEHLEVGQVELVPICFEVAEQTSAKVAIVEDETAEVAVEALYT